MDTFPDVSTIEPMPMEADFESATFMEPPGAAPEKPKRIVSEKQKAHLDRIRASAVAARRAKAAAKRVPDEAAEPSVETVEESPKRPAPKPPSKPARVPTGGMHDFQAFMQHMETFEQLTKAQEKERRAAQEHEQALEARIEARVRAKIKHEQGVLTPPPTPIAADLPEFTSMFM
jgi:hypothetical protein